MSTYTPIASITLASAASEVTFSGIPQTYTDLVIVGTPLDNVGGGANVRMTFNGDTNTNYSRTELEGNGSSAYSGRGSNQAFIQIAVFNDAQNTMLAHIMNYTNTTTNKTALARSGTAGGYVRAVAGLWRSTSAITSISLTNDTTNFEANSTFNLYGIANASITNVAKATGGDSVYTDGTYWYHIFRSSGTFTPTQALTADYLVVAGGGGGGGSASNSAGGGGAGGMRCTVTATGGGGSLESALSLTAQAYTVTVGAGGAGGVGDSNSSAGSDSVFATITSTGGGLAGQGAGGSGGSGGGTGGESSSAGGAGTTNQGYAGGAGRSGAGAAGGGGGAGAAGSQGGTGSSGAGGNGGNGVATSITGSSVTYAGGGGGGHNVSGTVGGNGGTGGGGNAFNGANGNGSAGTANTGGGGGAAGRQSGGGTWNGGAGGSGIVIVRYAA